MKVATVRDLRNNFASLEALINEGEEIRIERRGEPVAVLVPFPKKSKGKVKMPDFAARLQAIWGDRVFTEEEVARMRADELAGEEG